MSVRERCDLANQVQACGVGQTCQAFAQPAVRTFRKAAKVTADILDDTDSVSAAVRRRPG